MTGHRVEIEYCRKCGFLLRAGWLAQELLAAFPDEIGELALRPGSGGILRVRVGDQVIFSNKDEGGVPDVKELKRRLARALGSDRTFGHA